MTFPAQTSRKQVAIGQVKLYLADPSGTPASRTAEYKIELLDGGGHVVETVSGNLVPYLSAGQISGLQGLMDFVRAKATEYLPG